MENLGFHTLNGRTKGDIPGKFTYINNSGKSTIDLAWANVECIENISHFSITATTSSSDHCICTIHFHDTKREIKLVTNRTQSTHFDIKFKFNANHNASYKNHLNRLENIYVNSGNVEELNTNLITAIKEAASLSGMLNVSIINSNKTFKNHKPWFNHECLN